MGRKWVDFLQSNCGQDLAEYCLITAILALIGFGMFYKLSGGMQDHKEAIGPSNPYNE